MCEIRPPVTLWGTTQIKSFTTFFTTISDQVSTITKETIVTDVIPVQTRSYPCTSTTPSPSSTPTPSPSPEPTPKPQPQPQPQSSTEVEIYTSRAPVSSPSPSAESSRVSAGDTDSLTVDLSPSRTLSTTTTTRGTSTPVVLETVDPSPTPTNDPAAINESDTEPILSASSLFTDADHPDSTAGAALASSSGTQTALPIGAIVGIVLAALLVLSLLGFFIWTRKNKKDRDAEGDGDPYWERRFQQLESVQSQSKPRLDTVQSPDDDEDTWRRHLTLNLGSYHPVIARPASRLSQISSFFGQSQQSQIHTSPQNRRLSIVNETQSQKEIDFSQPLADKWSLNTPTNASHGHGQGQNRPPSSKSNRSRIGSRKSNSDSEKLTERRSSAWPFSAIAAALSGNKARVEGGHRNESIEGRRGMEWIRTIVSSDSGFGFNHDSNRDPSSSNRGLPPPPRRGVSPMALNNLQTTTRGLQPHHHSQDDIHSPNPISPDLVSPNPPPSYVTRSESDGGTLSPRTEGSSPRQLAPSNSLRRKRVNKGLAVPDLALARDAISPSLWVDEDTLDRLEDRHQLPPLPMTSVAPLAISKRNPVPPPLPALPKTGPSAFAYNPDLVSKFSPDSSRASFATTHDGRQSVPAPPVPERDLHTYKVEDVPPSRRETDGDSIATRRYDRSAVTPQLPTLATSNADAFRQEMAEISASTGEDREERVISFHGGRK